MNSDEKKFYLTFSRREMESSQIHLRRMKTDELVKKNIDKILNEIKRRNAKGKDHDL